MIKVHLVSLVTSEHLRFDVQGTSQTTPDLWALWFLQSVPKPVNCYRSAQEPEDHSYSELASTFIHCLQRIVALLIILRTLNQQPNSCLFYVLLASR